MRVAIVHYWLLNMRGGEKVVEALCRMLPEADVFTLFYDPEQVSPLIRSRRVTSSFLNPMRGHYRAMLPLMPLALEHLDLRGYDLVISSESGPAKGILTHSSTRHVCYCHTPMRYLWDLYPDYLHEWTDSKAQRALMAIFGHYLRIWDYTTAARVDQFIANGSSVQRRIESIYRRSSRVIHPPVDVGSFYSRDAEDYYLMVSALVPYKRVDQAVAACSAMGRKLRVVGDGPRYKMLKRAAGPSVEFCGRVSDEELRGLYARCRAFLQPGEEDFGISSVEALASGKPIVALGRGGIREIATDGVSACLYSEPSIQALRAAIERFEGLEGRWDSSVIRATAERFSEDRFAEEFHAILAE